MTDRIGAINDALYAPLRRVYGEQQPMHWGTLVRWADGGPNPHDAVSAYWSEVGPHWHYVSWGLSELSDKVTPNPHVSGWGFELTFRLAATLSERSPGAHPAAAAPRWPLSLLDDLAKVVFDRQVEFFHGQSIGFGRPWDPAGRLTAALFVDDPQLGTIDTLNGRVRYLQVAGLVDRSELERLRSDEHHPQTMAALAGPEGLYVTRTDRSPV